MADMVTVTTYKAAEIKYTTKNIGALKQLSHLPVTDQATFREMWLAANAGVGSATSFTGVAVGAEG